MSYRLYIHCLYKHSSGVFELKGCQRAVPKLTQSGPCSIVPIRCGNTCGRQTRLRRTEQTLLSSSAVALLAFGFWIGGSILLNHQSSKSKSIANTGLSEDSFVLKDDELMATAALSGRPGNLTHEQEEKLQELWRVTLKVFGVPVLGADGDTESITGSLKGESQEGLGESINSQNIEKKKKKRISMFGRKKHDKDARQVNGTTASASDGDDKYGQTKEFHEALASQAPEELRKAFWSMAKHDHPDGLLLRFLRARKWDVEKALIMLISTMHWRSQEAHVDDKVILEGELQAFKDSTSTDSARQKEGRDFIDLLRQGESFLHGTDKEGRPMCIVRVRMHKQGAQSEEAIERFTIQLMETARLLLSPPVDTAAIIFDMTDFSMANMDYTPVKFLIRCFEANYPESLGVVLVHKSPWVFQSIWRIIRAWLDPVVASKVHFTRNTEELEAFIAPSQIMTELGGADSWTYQYVEPVPGENDAMADAATRQQLEGERAVVVREFEHVTQEWVAGMKEDVVLKRRNDLAEELRKGYWRLDPYVRARTFYDRTGIIGENGEVKIGPAKAKAKVEGKGAVAPEGPIPAGHNVDDLD